MTKGSKVKVNVEVMPRSIFAGQTGTVAELGIFPSGVPWARVEWDTPINNIAEYVYAQASLAILNEQLELF